MTCARREFLVVAGSLAVGCVARGAASIGSLGENALDANCRIRAIALDAFVLFDPRPFAAALEASFPGRGASLAASFRARLFDYGWLRALGGRYVDFGRVSEDALDATADAERLKLSAAMRTSLLNVWNSLPPWPDAVDGVLRLADRGLDLAVLSNWSPRMIDEALDRSGLRGTVRSLSTDAARTYKPDPRAYALAPAAFGRALKEILFVAFAGWDAAGASWFGFPTVWMNRAGAPSDRLDLQNVAPAKSFGDLVL